MTTRALVSSAATTLVLLLPAAGLPHHSNSAFEVQKIITVAGTVREFRWSNPHTRLFLVADDGKGGKVEWDCEGRAPGILGRAGWTRHSLKAGEIVTVDMSPAKDGSPAGLIARVTKADGTILGNQPVFQ
jgi:hypothetical protein